jgi:site-specific recombinase XerD
MLISQAIDSFLYSREAIACAEQTVVTYRHELTSLFGRFLEAAEVRETEKISADLLVRYMNWTHARGVSANTLISYRQRLLVFVNWCGAQGYCAPDIARSVPKPRRREYLRKTHTQAEVQEILRTANDPALYHPFDSQELTALVLLLLDTGLRAGEVCGLNVGDLDAELVRIRGKGDRERLVCISPLTRKALGEYLDMRRFVSPESPLFINRGLGSNYARRGGRLTTRAVHQRIKRLGERAGIATHPHRWRHTFSAFALANGANLKALQHFLGHTSVQTTDLYLRGFGYQDAALAHKTFSPVAAMMQH